MILILKVEVPASAEPSKAFANLHHAAVQRQGVTITTHLGHAFDVDLYEVRVADSREVAP